MASRWTAVALLLTVAVAGCVVRSVNQPAGACVQPQPLCGEWAGAWDADGTKGEAYLTVTRVSGRDVEGLVLLRGRFPEHGKDLPFTAIFEQNALDGTILTGPESAAIAWRLRLNDSGTELKGRGFSAGWSDLYLVKRR